MPDGGMAAAEFHLKFAMSLFCKIIICSEVALEYIPTTLGQEDNSSALSTCNVQCNWQRSLVALPGVLPMFTMYFKSIRRRHCRNMLHWRDYLRTNYGRKLQRPVAALDPFLSCKMEFRGFLTKRSKSLGNSKWHSIFFIFLSSCFWSFHFISRHFYRILKRL